MKLKNYCKACLALVRVGDDVFLVAPASLKQDRKTETEKPHAVVNYDDAMTFHKDCFTQMAGEAMAKGSHKRSYN
jgi:hypothetical protein